MTKSKFISFSPDGERLAHSGPDGVLRIWNTKSGVLEHEYQPAKHLKATTSCVEYSPPDDKGHSFLAMGTIAGTILLYSPERAEVRYTLEHSTRHPVVDLAWVDMDKLISVGGDNNLIEWDIRTGKIETVDKVAKTNAICCLTKKVVIVGNLKIQQLARLKSGKRKVKHEFTGHSTAVTQLKKVLKRKDSTVGYFLSSSLDDRFVNAWSWGSDVNVESPVCSFMVKDTVVTMAVAKEKTHLLTASVTTSKGALVLFKHNLNGNPSTAPIESTGRLQIVTEKQRKKTVIPIVTSHFCNDTDGSIIIVYNRDSVFTFERIAISKIVGDVELIREEPLVPKKLSLMKTVTPYIDSRTTVVESMLTATKTTGKAKRKRGDEDNVGSLPMEERLNVLALDTSGPQGSAVTNDLAQLLLQGLHSKDQRILQNVFDRGEVKVINRSVKRLPVQAIVPLVEYLSDAVLRKGHRNTNYLKWLRSVLYNHMGHLTTVPDRKELMQSFMNIGEARMSTYTQVAQLHARLDLVLTQVSMRKEEVQQDVIEPEALLVYREESSDEEDMLDTMVGVSESEDNWDELDASNLLNGPTDEEESDMEAEETEERRGVTKRKLDHSGMNGDIGEESDDEEGDEEDGDDAEESEDDEEEDDDEDDDAEEAAVNGDGEEEDDTEDDEEN